MTRSRTRLKNQRRGMKWAQDRTCINCGQPGRHYVGPSLGDPGFFICAARGSTEGPQPPNEEK